MFPPHPLVAVDALRSPLSILRFRDVLFLEREQLAIESEIAVTEVLGIASRPLLPSHR